MLVTGASRGIGAAIAHGLAANGDRVAIHHSGTKGAADVLRTELPGTGHTVVAAEMTDPDAVRAMVDEAADALGGLDVVVNNAGIFSMHPVFACDYRDWQRAWQRTIGVNLYGPAMVTWAALRHMPAGGRLVYVSSGSAFWGERSAPAYAASKAALNALAQSMALELASRGIAVTAVAPGLVETDMTREALASPAGVWMRGRSPFQRVATVDEVAAAVLYLASPGAEWTSGAVLDLNGASYVR